MSDMRWQIYATKINVIWDVYFIRWCVSAIWLSKEICIDFDEIRTQCRKYNFKILVRRWAKSHECSRRFDQKSEQKMIFLGAKAHISCKLPLMMIFKHRVGHIMFTSKFKDERNRNRGSGFMTEKVVEKTFRLHKLFLNVSPEVSIYTQN